MKRSIISCILRNRICTAESDKLDSEQPLGKQLIDVSSVWLGLDCLEFCGPSIPLSGRRRQISLDRHVPSGMMVTNVKVGKSYERLNKKIVKN